MKDLQRDHAAGCRGIYISPDLCARAYKRFDDAHLHCFWAVAAAHELPRAFHVVVRDQATSSYLDPCDGGGIGAGPGLLNFAFLAIDLMGGFLELLSTGVLQRYPRLHVAVLEAGANWIAAWLDRLDHEIELIETFTRLKMKPSEYFRRQRLIAADPDESMTAEIVRHLGADYFIWASDNPHMDASMWLVAAICERLAALPEADRHEVLGANVLRFYRLAA